MEKPFSFPNRMKLISKYWQIKLLNLISSILYMHKDDVIINVHDVYIYTMHTDSGFV